MAYTTNTYREGNWVVEYDDRETGEHRRIEYAFSDLAYEDYLHYEKQWWTKNVKYYEE
jgi:hypothetical protein